MSKFMDIFNRESRQVAIEYYLEHPDLTQEDCAKKLGIDSCILSSWIKQHQDTNEEIRVCSSENCFSDEQAEIDRLKLELRYTQDALDDLKKAIGILKKD